MWHVFDALRLDCTRIAFLRHCISAPTKVQSRPAVATSAISRTSHRKALRWLMCARANRICESYRSVLSREIDSLIWSRAYDGHSYDLYIYLSVRCESETRFHDHPPPSSTDSMFLKLFEIAERRALLFHTEFLYDFSADPARLVGKEGFRRERTQYLSISLSLPLEKERERDASLNNFIIAYSVAKYEGATSNMMRATSALCALP